MAIAVLSALPAQLVPTNLTTHTQSACHVKTNRATTLSILDRQLHNNSVRTNVRKVLTHLLIILFVTMRFN